MNKEDDSELIYGDALKVMANLKGSSFDACITDPPYNISGYDNKKEIGWLKSNSLWKKEKNFDVINENWDKFSDEEYINFTTTWLKLATKLVKKNGALLIFGTYHNIFLIGSMLQTLNKKINNSIVWYKRNAFPNITNRMLCESTEYIVWAVNNSKKDAKNWTFNYEILKEMNNGKQMRNMWDVPYTFSKTEKAFGKHPAQKPTSIIERLVLGFTNKDDKILDPFMGGGTVPYVCLTNDRRFSGIEIDKKYYDVAKKRIQNNIKHTTSSVSFQDMRDRI